MQTAATNDDLRGAGATSWCALHTQHQHEKSVATILANKGFEIFLPTYETVRRWTDRNKRLILPLFPCYLFFVDHADRRIQILSTPGVHSIVKAGSDPAVIPNQEVDAIRRMVESRFGVAPHPFLHDGDHMRITFGPLAGLEGILSRKKDALRLVLSVNLLGRSAAVEINADQVERVGTTRPANFNASAISAIGSGPAGHKNQCNRVNQAPPANNKFYVP